MASVRELVVVTGSASGIGAATVAALGERGFHVVAGVRRAKDRARLAGPLVTPVLLDVTRQASVDAAARTVRRLVGRGGRLAGLVNAAGVAFAAPLEWTTPADFSHLFAVNVVGVFRVTHALLPLLRKGGGRVVNVSSGSGQVTAPFTAAYSASKFALESLSDGLRMELAGHGVQVALVEPGPVATPLWDRVEAQMARVERETSPERRAPWARAWSNFRALLAHARGAAVPVDRVVADIVDALTAATPKTRAFEASLELEALRAMPDLERDVVLRAAWGLG